jgi:hypothetical protein
MANARIVPWMGHDCFLPDLFQLTTSHPTSDTIQQSFGGLDLGLVNFRTYKLIFPCWFSQWYWPPRGSLRASVLWHSVTPISIRCGAEMPELCVLPSHIIGLPSSNLQTKGFFMPARGCVRSFLMNFWLLSWVMVSRRMEQARTWVTTVLIPWSTV